MIADFHNDRRADDISIGSDCFLYRFESDDTGRFGTEGKQACEIKFDRPQVLSQR